MNLKPVARLVQCAVVGLTFVIGATQPKNAHAQSKPDVLATQVDPQFGKPQAAPLESNSAAIAGVVLDESGASVMGAEVKITNGLGSLQRSMNSGPHGEFQFDGIPNGSYVVLVSAKGFESFKSSEISIANSQVYEVPAISLAVSARRTEFNVRPTEEIAAEQVKAEEQQRLFGIIPNFYTSYLFDAAPLSTKQKFSLSFHSLFDPVRFIGSAVIAGIGQERNSQAGYGQGVAGYSKRFGARYADGFTGDLLSHAVFPSIFHQDPRYFYQGSGTRKSRLLHAISFALVARSDAGHRMPNYAFLFGDISSGAISNLYYPKADRGAGLVFTNAAIAIGGRAAGAVLREFVLKRVTTNVHGNGKP